ncbi:MAG: hypothetical protein AB2421_11715 [Thermotaleaceae bacterium]
MTTKKISSANQTRIHSMYVARNTEIGKIDGVKPIDKVAKVDNNSFQASENAYLGTSTFYSQLKALKEQYHAYYRAERELDETREENKPETNEEMLSLIKTLIVKYNRAISALQDFDSHFGTQHSQGIFQLLLLYKPQLYKIGVTFDRKFQLFLNEVLFSQNLEQSKDTIAFLFEPKNGFISKVYRAFKEIKISSKKKYSNLTVNNPSIIDKKF